MSESESRPTVPYISIEGSAQDIVGVAALLRNADLDLSLTPDAEFHQEGIQTIPERLGRVRGTLYGEEVSFHLNPACNDEAVRFFARGVIERLNILVAALDPNFEYLEGVSAATWPGGYYIGDQTKIVETDLAVPKLERAGSTLGRHVSLGQSLKARQELLWNDECAALVMETLTERPTWNAIYAAFETMKHDLKVRDLYKAGLMTKEQEKAFGKAANNRTDRITGARHGINNRNQKHANVIDHLGMMTLLEARELHRQAVHRYLDRKTGHETGYEVVDNIGERMGFGLNKWVRDLSNDQS